MSNPVQLGFWAALFDWLAKKLPPLLAAFGIGYKFGRRDVVEAENKALELKFELEKLQNEEAVKLKHEGMSDADIVRDAIEQGRRGGAD